MAHPLGVFQGSLDGWGSSPVGSIPAPCPVDEDEETQTYGGFMQQMNNGPGDISNTASSPLHLPRVRPPAPFWYMMVCALLACVAACYAGILMGKHVYHVQPGDPHVWMAVLCSIAGIITMLIMILLCELLWNRVFSRWAS